jgi:maltose-binding protein MalE
MVEFPQLNRQVVLDAQKYAAPLLNPPGYDQIEPRLREAITDVYEGRKNARQAMTELQGPINALIKAAND